MPNSEKWANGLRDPKNGLRILMRTKAVQIHQEFIDIALKRYVVIVGVAGRR